MWKDLLGQQRIKSILSNTYLKKRIPHALLFHGPDGVGKDAAAAEFAMLMNCESPVEGSEACGECKSCKDISGLRPPLMRFITALPTGKNESEDKDPLLTLEQEDADTYLNELSLKANDKYHQINIPGANDIRISSIRQLKDQASLTGYSGKKKIFLISRADRMNPQSSNALLKILEEPPEDTILILTTARISSLLPTIVGRCQMLRFDPLSEDEIFSFIMSRFPGTGENQARFYAALSQGSITACKEIMSKDYLELRETAITYLANVITHRHLGTGREIDTVISGKDKQKVKRFLSLLSVWFRDAALVNAGFEVNIVNTDKLERLKKFSENYDHESYAIMKLIEEAIQDVDRNIFPELLLTDLAVRISGKVKRRNGRELNK